MEEYQQIIGVIALTMGTAWASGINLYATILVLGIMGLNGSVNLPPDLQILASPVVIAAAGLMYMVEFTADKIPGVDNAWDALHTLIRVPAGAVLAAGAVGDVNLAVSIAAAIVGGGVAMSTHVTKAGSRVLINTSPEPVTNWTASITEDLVVIGGLWTALNHPSLFLLAFVLFMVLLIWLIPKLWGAIKTVFGKIMQWLGREDNESNNAVENQTEEKLEPLLKLEKNK